MASIANIVCSMSTRRTYVTTIMAAKGISNLRELYLQLQNKALNKITCICQRYSWINKVSPTNLALPSQP